MSSRLYRSLYRGIIDLMRILELEVVSTRDAVTFGIDEVDRLLGGGMKQSSLWLMEVETGTEELTFAASFINEGLRQKSFCAIVTIDLPAEEIISGFEGLGVNMSEAIDDGSMVIADLWQEGKYDPEKRGPIFMTENPKDLNSVIRVYYELAEIGRKKLESGKFGGSRVFLYSLSTQIMNFRFDPIYKMGKIGIDIARKMKHISLSAVHPKMFEEKGIAALEQVHDGVLVVNPKSCFSLM